jgi:hypothetical protein
MKKFKELVAEIYDYPPTTKDEKEFINMHTVKTFDYPVKNDHGLPFRDDRIKAPGPQHKKLATYEPPKEPTTVYTKANEEVEQVDEAGMSASTIKHKTNISKMSPEEFANHPHYNKMSDKELQSMAWRHGYGGPGTSGHDYYVNKRKKGMNEEVEQVDEASKEDDDKVKEYIEKGGKVTVGKPRSAKGISYMKNMSRHKGSSPAAKMAYKEEVDLKEKKLPSMHIYVNPIGGGKHEVFNMSHDVDADHPSKPGTPLEPGHIISDGDVKKLQDSGHTIAHESEMEEEVNIIAELSELRSLLGVDPNVQSINETFEYDDMLSILALVSDTNKEMEIFFEESEEGLVIDKEIADILLNVYENLDEESQEKFEAALTLSNESFDYCVDFCSEVLKEEDENEHN